MRYRLDLRCLVALVGLVMAPGRAQAALPEAAPASLGLDAGRLKRIDGAIDRAIERGQVPGAVVLVGRRGAIVYARAAGRRALEPTREPMTRDTVFDLASLAKPIVTATAVMILVEEGRLRLADRVVRTLPELDNHGVIILTSRLHPDGREPSPTSLRAQVATLAASAIVDVPGRPASSSLPPARPDNPAAKRPAVVDLHPLQCGIDVLVEDRFASLRGLSVGLVTNHTGRARDGKSTIDVLFHAPGVKLVRLFSPEHGIRGELDTVVPDGKDSATGLPIVSLYGNDKKPRARDLVGLDALIYDIQDVGTRFYTYITTLGLVLEAAQESGKKVFVLDRPNPIGGRVVSGPVRDKDLGSFIAYHALPVRHGMTVGELALLYNAERKIGASIVVVRCRGWRRDDLYDRTGLVWINPSPNMRSLTEALLYPGIGLMEATNLATGRGTDAPFERVGAPWIEPAAFAAALNSRAIPGVRFVPIFFTPSQRQYAGQKCGGVQILVTSWAEFDPLRLGITLAVELRIGYPKEWQPEGLLRLLADQAAYQDILAAKPVDAIMERWNVELTEFRKIRSRYLLY